ncbi:MAG: CDP-glycerol glycerophosphotransferase family protein [Tissierella sp.]|uniref:CDP-glycerol glycerophosphotransferase family protein n=1 Tax=Tissierella sp. TaxID=41274 RepID=UPI003F970AE5
MKNILKKILPKQILKFIIKLRMGNYYYLFNLFPINKNKIVFSNYYGKGYGDNGKYICNEIIENKYNYELIWLTNKSIIDKANFPKQVTPVKYKSFRGLYELATAGIWIDNCRKMFYPPKKSKQHYIQTWHGGIALKQIEKDVENKLSEGYIISAKEDSKIADTFISNSEFCTDMYRNSFWYNGVIKEFGSPRCDILLEKTEKINEKIKDYFKIDNNNKILIYAPTFRADGNLDVYDVNFNELLNSLEKKFLGKWTILVRLHPNLSNKSNFIKYDKNIINASQYDDMYELLAASDILLTDYSSTMFEFAITYKPVILYTKDIEEYKKDRNFYFDIYSLPFPIAENNSYLLEEIENFQLEEYKSKIKNFFKDIGMLEKGTASQNVVEYIRKEI